jgi:hypothetical protein
MIAPTLLLVCCPLPLQSAHATASLPTVPLRATHGPAFAPDTARFVWWDWSGDGRLDALAADEDGGARLLLQSTDGHFEDCTLAAGLGGATWSRAAFGDFDRDGRADLFVLGPAGEPRLYLQADRGRFLPVDVDSAPAVDAVDVVRHAWSELCIVDVDADGRLDVHVTGQSAHRVLRGRGDGSFDVQDLGSLPALVEAGSVTAGTSVQSSGSAGGPTAGTFAPAVLGQGLGPVLVCAGSIDDLATGACLEASSVPVLGRLYPISSTWFVTQSGLVGVGTTTPAVRLDVAGVARAHQLVSSASTGTPPLFISSRTLVPLLNCDQLDGLDATAFRQVGVLLTTTDLAPGSVTTDKLALGAVASDRIADGAVTTDKLADFAVNSDALADGAVSASKLANGAVGPFALAPGSVTSSAILDGTVTEADLAAASVGSAKLQDSAVNTFKILDGSVQTVDLAAGSVTTDILAVGAVASDRIAVGAVTLARIGLNAVDTGRIIDGSILGADLAVGAVSSLAILNGSITSLDLADGSINAAALAPGAVDGSAIADGAIRDVDVNASAAIQGTKIRPDFGAQTVTSVTGAEFGNPTGSRAELGAASAPIRGIGSGLGTALAGDFLGRVAVAASNPGLPALDVSHSAGSSAARVTIVDSAGTSTAPALHVVATGDGAARGVLVESLGLANTGAAFQVVHSGAGVGLDITSGALPLRLDRSINAGTLIEARNSLDVEFRVDSSGDVFCDSTFVGGGADYAEWLELEFASELIEPGDVVGVRSGKVSKTLAGAERFMVASTNPVVIGNHSGAEDDVREGHAVIAFVGRAAVKVRGRAAPGDVLVPSGLGDGTAVALAPERVGASDLGRVIGTAWSAAEGDGVQLVDTLVGVGVERAASAALERLERELRARDEVLERELGSRDQQILRLTARLEALERR